MVFFEKIKDVLNSGDEEVRTWFLVRESYLPFILCGCYVIFSNFGPKLMKNRKPFELREVMVVFNFVLVAIHIVYFFIALWYISSLPADNFCGTVIIKKGEVLYTLASIGWLFYVMKYVEFVDTVFFVLRKKENQITFLHIVHHSVVPIVGWILLRTERNALMAIPGFVHAVVHIITYLYYGLSAMGPKVHKYLWWKKYITQLQMVQFVFIFLYVAILVPLSGCTMVISSYLMNIVITPLFLILFYRFYRLSFMSEKESNINKKECAKSLA